MSRGTASGPIERVHDLASADLAQARAALLAWYGARGRALPWRATADPYAVWISEAMLQQTRVATAVPYYARWMARFPDVADLARAPLDEVLSAWQGLGYYARARNLHAAARAVVADHDGRLPQTAAGLRALPGIGDYTAAAVASIAFGEPVAAVDGNIERVMARWHGIDDDVGRAAGRRAVREAAACWVVGPSPGDTGPAQTIRGNPPASSTPNRPSPGDVNQALMELGATVCTPREPSCDACPIAAGCAARAAGRAAELPVKRRAAAPRRAEAIAWILAAPGGARLVARRPERGLLGGLWEFPLSHVTRMPDPPALARLAAERLGVRIGPLAVRPPFVHAFSHLRLSVTPLVGELAAGSISAAIAEPPAPYWSPDAAAGDAAYDALAWLDDDELAARPMSTLMRRLVAARDDALAAGDVTPRPT